MRFSQGCSKKDALSTDSLNDSVTGSTVNQGVSGVYGFVGPDDNASIPKCNIKSIQQTKLKRMGQNPIFGSLDHRKKAFLRFLNDPTWVI